MPRPKNSVPQKRAHISWQDRVYLHGKHYYLGPSGSEEAHTRYDALVAIYLSNDRTMPEDTPSHQAELSPTVAHITQVFRGAIKTKYANSPDEARRLLALCRELDDYFGDVLAEQFGPLKLESVRDLLVASGITRRTINGHIKSVHRPWKREHMQVQRKQHRKRRFPGGSKNGCVRHRTRYKDHVWLCDFATDRTDDGRELRLLVVIDEYTRQCLATEVGRLFAAQYVMGVL